MASFIYTSKGYVNLDTVQMATSTKDIHRHKIIVNDESIDDNNINFGNTIISLIPINSEWEVLFPCEEQDGTFSTYAVEPVLAWGLNAIGITVPITPQCMDGVSEHHALRKVGDPRVYCLETMYENADFWIASYKDKQAA